MVLKIYIPRDGDHARREIVTLGLANGEGCARLLNHDEVLGARLVERLGPSLRNLGLPMSQLHVILCDVAKRMWRAAPDCGLPTGRQKTEEQSASICSESEKLDHPCSESAVDYALECGQRRAAAHDDERAVLIHGDVHQWNTLQARGGFKLVDPDGGPAEAECELGVLMREDPVELTQGDPSERARDLAARCGLDAEAICEWGVIELVWNGLLCTRDDLQPFGRQMLQATEICAQQRFTS